MIIRVSTRLYGPPPEGVPEKDIDPHGRWFLIDSAKLPPKNVAKAPRSPTPRRGIHHRWTTPGQPDAILDAAVASAHDWRGATPVIQIEGDPFTRTLAEVNVFGIPTECKAFAAMPGVETIKPEFKASIDHRQQWLEKWTGDDVASVLSAPKPPPPPSLIEPPCMYRGEVRREADCASCKGTVKVKVYHCSLFGECNLGTKGSGAGKACRTCKAREVWSGQTELIPFASFNQKYAGREGWIFGRGPTTYDKEQIANIKEPIWFINDAVDWERFASHADTFFCALEFPKFEEYAWRCRSMVMAGFMNHHPLDGIRRVVQFVHRWHRTENEDDPQGPLWHLLSQTRDQLADSRILYQHASTMLIAIHFAWFCGVRKLNLVGCDCIPTEKRNGKPATSQDPVKAYNPELPQGNDDGGGRSGGKHPMLRRRHEAVMKRLGLEWEYHGTPVL